MESVLPRCALERDIRFLEYRLDVIGRWPDSPRKQAAWEAVSRRLTSIARDALASPEIVSTSCRLLDTVFSAGAHQPSASRRAA